MIAGIASLVFIPLLAIFFAHALWTFGSTWPVHDEKLLAKTVIGKTGVEQMPPRWRTAGVALFAIAAGIVALALSDPNPPVWLEIIGWLIAALFLARGVLGFTTNWRDSHTEEPFASFDRKLYTPLCLGLWAGFVFLNIWRML